MMRRALHSLFTILSVMSLLLCVAVCVLWIRSFAWSGDQWLWTRPTPSAAWGPSHYMMGPSPFPVLDVIEKFTAGSFRGRIRLRHVSWFAQDTTLYNNLFGVEQAPVPIAPLPGVTRQPGLAWDAGDAMRISLWLENHETTWPLGFAAERGFWDAGFSSGFGPIGEWSAYEQAVEIPHWSLAFVTAILPALMLRRVWVRWRRFGAGRCSVCGYDLRASPERCPECGAIKMGSPATAVIRN